MAGTMLGAAMGAGGALWQLQRRTAGVSIANRAVGAAGALTGAKRLIVGPHPNPNYPWVILDRALLHLEVVRRWSHARQDREDARVLVEAVVAEFEAAPFARRLAEGLRRSLQSSFHAVRRGDNEGAPEDLRRTVTKVISWLETPQR